MLCSQAEVMGEMITWLVPHQFTQSLPREVDFRVMLTFLEFYEVLLKFTLFKLYHSQGWTYPPVLEEGGVGAGEQSTLPAADVTTAPTPAPSKSRKQKVDEKLQAKVTALIEDMDGEGDSNDMGDGEDDEEMGSALTSPLYSALGVVEGQGELERRTFDMAASGRLFSGLVFFLNREIPRASLVLCIVSFGGQVGWQGSGSPILETDPRITHHIIDRPLASTTLKTREYVQPQWVFDSINAQILLPVRGYGVGVALPPHLSPFVDDEREGYVPEYRQVIEKIKGGGSASEGGAGAGSLGKGKGEKMEVEAQEGSDEEEGEDSVEESGEEEEGEDSEDDGADSEAETVEEEPQTHSKKGPKAIVYKTNNPKVSEVSLPCLKL
ncbi:hypothetical protein EON64_09085 [archaeon]|nr:MAG: hypothetical protein EON64_09085 [archaeon]